MDMETRAALLTFKDDIIRAVDIMIKEAVSGLEKHLTEISELRFAMIDKESETYKRWHKQHFDFADETRKTLAENPGYVNKEIAKKIEPLENRIASLENRQTKDEVKGDTKDKIVDLNMNKVIVICAIAGGIITLVGLIIGIIFRN